MKPFIGGNSYPPIKLKKDKNIIACNTDDNTIVGIMGLNERYFWLKNKKLKSCELTTWCKKRFIQ